MRKPRIETPEQLEGEIKNAIQLVGGLEFHNIFKWTDFYDILKNPDLQKIFLKYFISGGKSGQRLKKSQCERSKNFIIAIIAGNYKTNQS